MEVTKREILFSIIIVAVVLMISFGISDRINDSILDANRKYDTALQIENDTYLFQHSMDTNIGYAFVHGDLEAVDTVSYPEIGGEYSYIKKVKERYTRHTRTVTYYTGSGKHRKAHHRTEVYWTWDKVGSEEKHCKNISFTDVQFKYGEIEIPGSVYISTIKESSKIRYKYYGCNTKYTGTLFANLKDDTISETQFFTDMTIQETIDSLESGAEIVLFWVFWILLIIGVVIGFCHLENRWLE